MKNFLVFLLIVAVIVVIVVLVKKPAAPTMDNNGASGTMLEGTPQDPNNDMIGGDAAAGATVQ